MHSYKPGDLVLLHDSKASKKKFQPSFNGPFVISGYGGDHNHSYTLKQLNGKPIKRTFYGDHLRLFIPRTGHLVNSTEEELPQFQTIRAGRHGNRAG